MATGKSSGDLEDAEANRAQTEAPKHQSTHLPTSLEEWRRHKIHRQWSRTLAIVDLAPALTKKKCRFFVVKNQLKVSDLKQFKLFSCPEIFGFSSNDFVLFGRSWGLTLHLHRDIGCVHLGYLCQALP